MLSHEPLKYVYAYSLPYALASVFCFYAHAFLLPTYYVFYEYSEFGSETNLRDPGEVGFRYVVHQEPPASKSTSFYFLFST